LQTLKKQGRGGKGRQCGLGVGPSGASAYDWGKGKGNAGGEKSLVRYVRKINQKSKK
jgi:hypothetical protein